MSGEMIKPSVETTTSSYEMIKSSVAAIQDGVARADGKLSLSETEVFFEPFNRQFGLGPYRFKRDDIASVSHCLGKGGGIIPVTCDAIRITLSNAAVYEFITAAPGEWIAALDKVVSKQDA